MPDAKPMTPQRMREIANLLLVEANEHDLYVKYLHKLLEAAEAGQRIIIEERVFLPDDLRKSLKRAEAKTAELAPKRAAAYELQAYSYTMKG